MSRQVAKPTEAAKTTLSELKENGNIWYKIHVLIYDLYNIKTDRSSESRIERTLDELYISEPYFTAAEAGIIKNTLVETTTTTTTDIPEEAQGSSNETVHPATKTIEAAIQERLSTFYEKRKASGDFRPCGPHDMVPVYLSVFGILREELGDEGFLRRLRRSGLDEWRDRIDEVGNKEGKKKGKHGR